MANARKSSVSLVKSDNVVTPKDLGRDALVDLVKLRRSNEAKKLAILGWGHFQNKIWYKTFREAFSRKESPWGLKTTMAFLSEALSKNLEVGVAGAGGDVLESITSYPFVVVEPTFRTQENFTDLFIEEGAINLPFPRLTVLTATNFSLDKKAFNCISPVFLSQADNGSINVHIVMGITSELIFKQPHIASINISVTLNPNTQKLAITPALPESQIGWIDYELYTSLCDIALTAIYMLTYHTGEILLHKPSVSDVAVNRKRARKGKAPLIEFKLVSITGKETKREIEPHGTHAPPKQHWRRGHWRNCKSGKRAWIPPMLVGDEKNGKIIKDYAIGNYRDSGSRAIIR